MLFNSVEFLVFLPVVLALYWLVWRRSLRGQNLFVLIASYFFYACWDWRFLSLIAFTTAVDYFAGLGIHGASSPRRRRLFLWISIAVNLGLLGFFKYFNFFVESWVEMLSMFGYSASSWSVGIVLPIGISFYTFQTMSYSLDIYRGQIKPTRDFIAFAAFVSFFPQLVAGPIERASHLLPQMLKNRAVNSSQAVSGVRRILWGMSKKLLVADALAPFVQEVFLGYDHLPPSTLALGLACFHVQIYCDFSGYSDIAIGTAKLFGFELNENFKYPFFSRSIPEYWRRWHVSLTTWFNDYVFFPLNIALRHRGKLGLWLSVLTTFLISGLWHGAAWTFILWGLLHGLYFLGAIFGKKRLIGVGSKTITKADRLEALIPSPRAAIQLLRTFALTSLTMAFFRSRTVEDAFGYIKNLFDVTAMDQGDLLGFGPQICLGAGLILVEWMNKAKTYPLEFSQTVLPRSARWVIYLGLAYMCWFQLDKPQEFIYFQF